MEEEEGRRNPRIGSRVLGDNKERMDVDERLIETTDDEADEDDEEKDDDEDDEIATVEPSSPVVDAAPLLAAAEQVLEVIGRIADGEPRVDVDALNLRWAVLKSASLINPLQDSV